MTDNIIRQSQLITTYGPGAMIDLPDVSVIVSGLDDWSHLRRERIEEARLVGKLRRLLDVQQRVFPPVDERHLAAGVRRRPGGEGLGEFPGA